MSWDSIKEEHNLWLTAGFDGNLLVQKEYTDSERAMSCNTSGTSQYLKRVQRRPWLATQGLQAQVSLGCNSGVGTKGWRTETSGLVLRAFLKWNQNEKDKKTAAHRGIPGSPHGVKMCLMKIMPIKKALSADIIQHITSVGKDSATAQFGDQFLLSSVHLLF